MPSRWADLLPLLLRANSALWEAVEASPLEHMDPTHSGPHSDPLVKAVGRAPHSVWDMSLARLHCVPHRLLLSGKGQVTSCLVICHSPAM